MEDLSYTQAVIVFGALALLDYVWAMYTYAMTQHRTMKAGVLAAALIVLSGTATIGYTQDARMLVPAALGAFVGTVAAVWAERRRGKSDAEAR